MMSDVGTAALNKAPSWTPQQVISDSIHLHSALWTTQALLPSPEIGKGTVQNVGRVGHTSSLECIWKTKAHFLGTKLYVN